MKSRWKLPLKIHDDFSGAKFVLIEEHGDVKTNDTETTTKNDSNRNDTTNDNGLANTNKMKGAPAGANARAGPGRAHGAAAARPGGQEFQGYGLHPSANRFATLRSSSGLGELCVFVSSNRGPLTVQYNA